ncbi:mechanosensitive ion channel family protein [Methyloversatilis discipulorum]|uniref:mechanosensitive ion channel family protein n=1 Tax=Methyloversatilis discipulorum TaxID=1119528 RepID=UPI001A54CACA|nr:mechanosensitive ion channel domain-containing protein [Methyloversatilis discipulorum]MBL8468722.1 mechanosensitive ion channel [Methyloversatilis discipulorum]
MPRSVGDCRAVLSPAAFVLALICLFCATRSNAQTPPAGAPSATPSFVAADVAGVEARGRSVIVNRREVVTFAVPLLDASPEDRARRAAAALGQVLAYEGPGTVTVWNGSETAGLKVDDELVFYLVAGDVESTRQRELEVAADMVRMRLQQAVLEVRERSDARRIGIGLAWSAAASAIALLLLNRLFWLRRKLMSKMESHFGRWQQARPAGDLLAGYAEHARTAANLAMRVLTWGGVALLIDGWLTFALHQFAYTRPWGERSTAWLLGVLEQFVLAIAAAIPGLIIAMLIFALARLSTRSLGALLERVERGEAKIGWLDLDTAGPTRRLGNLAIWLFAFAMAYPYLPGSHSEAFKGVSVLAGLMLSLGASSIVGQALSGFSLMYARALRPGEYVKVGDTEGTVMAVGLFSTRIHTGMGEEVSIPNAVMFSQPVRNFSRLVTDGQFVVQTGVTIGYSTPWRQVHAMLLEAARRTPGVAQSPAPYVLQTALSDFYVEYLLCAQIDKSAPARRAEALNQLHGNIQDVFNEYGVQIMSPHYRADTEQLQIVPRSQWWAAPAAAPADTSSGDLRER